MLKPSGRRPTLSQAAAARRSSLTGTGTLPAPRTQATSTTETARRKKIDTAAVAQTTAAESSEGAGIASPRSKSRPLAALRPAPSSLPPPPPPENIPAPDGDMNPSSINSSASGSNGDDRSTRKHTTGFRGMSSSPQGSSLNRPPPIDTSGLVGAHGPSSPPPRGKYRGPVTPPLGGSKAHGDSSRDHDQEEEENEKKQFLKTLATEAAEVITMGTLNRTSLQPALSRAQGDASSTESSYAGDDGDGGGDIPSANSFRRRRGSGTENELRSLSVPFRQLIAHHAPTVADHNPGRLESPRARPGAVRRGSGCEGMPLTGIRRRGSGSGIVTGSAGDGARSAKAAGFDSVRRGSRNDGGGSNASVAGGATARLAGGEMRRNSRGGSGLGNSGLLRPSGKPLTGIRRRGSGAGDEMADAIGDGVRWASSKPAISTRSNAIPSAGSSRGHAGTRSRRPSQEKEDPRHNSIRTASYTKTAKAAHAVQEREGTTPPTRGVVRATARRLSALGARAVEDIGFAGSGNGTTSGPTTGGGSPGAKGDGPPPPPSREQRRRMSAAPLTEQQLLLQQGAAASQQPRALPAEADGMASPPPASGMTRRRSSVQQELIDQFAAAQGIRDSFDISAGVVASATAAVTSSSYEHRCPSSELTIR